MKGVSEFVIVLIILIIAIASILVVWLFYNRIFGSVTTSGEPSSLGNTLSSCMKIDSVNGNIIYLRNCGTGTIRNDSTNVYIDDVPYNFSMSTASIGKGEIGAVVLNIQNLTLGNHKLRITNPSGEVGRFVKVVSSSASSEIIHLNFDEGSGNNTYDSSSYHNDGNLQNIYPLDVIVSNPSLEDPWHFVANASPPYDVNHTTNAPENWTSDKFFYNLSTSIMLGQKETSIVKDGSSAFNMTFKSIGSYDKNSGFCLMTNYTAALFPIDENQYIEGGNFQYPIKGLSIWYDISFYFYNATGDLMCRRQASSTNLESDLGDGWRIKSYVWNSSSGDPGPCKNDGSYNDIPYIPKGAKYAEIQQYFVYGGSNQDWQAMFDKFFVYQWPSMPSNSSRIDRASSGWVNGIYGKALRFDGYNDYINVSSSVSLNITGSITLMAWVYPDNLTGFTSLIEKDQNGGYRLGFNNNHPVFTLYGLWNASATGTVPLNGWTHVAATYDGQNVKIYINGTLDTTISHTDQIGTGTSPLIIGKRGSGTDYFNGIIDEVRIWNGALISQDINTAMQGGQVVTQGGPASLTLGETA